MKSTPFTRNLVSFLIRLAMICSYTIAGGFIFKSIEESSFPTPDDKEQYLKTIQKNLTLTYNMTEEVFSKLKEDFEFALSSTDKPWTIHNSLVFVTTVITTIGYGDMSPKTNTGQLVCIIYALFGIPITALYLKTVSDIIRAIVNRLWRICINKPSKSRVIKQLTCTTVFFLTCILLFSGAAGLYLSTEWTFIESLYCWFITFSTIGFGDFIPGDDLTEPTSGGRKGDIFQTMFKIGYMYMGLAFLASILSSMGDTIMQSQDNKCKCTNSNEEDDEIDETPYGVYYLKTMDTVRENGLTDNY